MKTIKTNSMKSQLFTRAHAYAKRVVAFRRVGYREAMSEALKEGYKSFKCVNPWGYTSAKYRNFWGGNEPRNTQPKPNKASLCFSMEDYL